VFELLSEVEDEVLRAKDVVRLLRQQVAETGGQSAWAKRVELLDPDSVNEYTITIGACCHSFAASHRIRIQVTSSNFPGIDRNPNTGGPLGMENAFEWVPASQTVLHDAGRPSCSFCRSYQIDVWFV
jgi:predicted acyl esterase